MGIITAVALALLWHISPPWSKVTNSAMVTVAGNTPLALSEATFINHTNPTQTIDVVVGLKLRNETDLNRLLERQSDPTSPDFRQFITPAQFLSTFSPTQNSVDKVVAHLKKQGLDVLEVTPNRLLVHVRGTVAQVEKTFAVRINVYEIGSRRLYSNDTDPSVPADIADVVESISGLNNIAVYHSRMQKTARPHSVGPAGFGVSDIATAYNYPTASNTGRANAAGTTYTGKGVTVAIATANTYQLSDIEAYWKQYGVNRTGTVTNVNVNGTATDLEGETTLDLQQVSSQAPGADVIMYLGMDPSFNSFALVFNQIVTDNKASVATVSWGLCEKNSGIAQMKTEHVLFKQGAAQGIAFFAAAGDDGAYDCQPTKGKHVASVDYPSSDPFVTAVGGTALEINADGSRKSETAWTGAGGGVSDRYDRPFWQIGPGIPLNGLRNTSDVALVADPNTGYSIFFQGQWDSAGGTSFASPAWAGLWADATEAYGGRLGPASPTVYRIARSKDYGTVFYDVRSGNNGNGNGPGFKAGKGWDHPTGWGSPNGVKLIEWLLQEKATPQAPGQPTQFPASQQGNVIPEHVIRVQGKGILY